MKGGLTVRKLTRSAAALGFAAVFALAGAGSALADGDNGVGDSGQSAVTDTPAPPASASDDLVPAKPDPGPTAVPTPDPTPAATPDPGTTPDPAKTVDPAADSAPGATPAPTADPQSVAGTTATPGQVVAAAASVAAAAEPTFTGVASASSPTSLTVTVCQEEGDLLYMGYEVSQGATMVATGSWDSPTGCYSDEVTGLTSGATYQVAFYAAWGMEWSVDAPPSVLVALPDGPDVPPIATPTGVTINSDGTFTVPDDVAVQYKSGGDDFVWSAGQHRLPCDAPFTITAYPMVGYVFADDVDPAIVQTVVPLASNCSDENPGGDTSTGDQGGSGGTTTDSQSGGGSGQTASGDKGATDGTAVVSMTTNGKTKTATPAAPAMAPTLASTGSNAAAAALITLITLIVGTAAVVVARRRHTSASHSRS